MLVGSEISVAPLRAFLRLPEEPTTSVAPPSACLSLALTGASASAGGVLADHVEFAGPSGAHVG